MAEAMLAGEYGFWSEGKKGPFVGDDAIRSWPVEANLTRYGIGIIDQSNLGGGGWSMIGGLLGRAALGEAAIELFGKRVTRVHGMKRVARVVCWTWLRLVSRWTERGRAGC